MAGNPIYGAGYHQGFDEGSRSGVALGAAGALILTGVVRWGPQGYRKLKDWRESKREFTIREEEAKRERTVLKGLIEPDENQK